MATIKYKDENGWQEIAIGGGESVEVVDNLESNSTTAALSANQGRVLKEMIDNLPSGGAAEGAKFYPIYSPKLMGTYSITEEQQAANKAAFEAAARSDNMWCYAVNYNGDDAKLNAQMVVRDDEGLLVTFIYTYIIPEQSVIQMMNQTYINSDGSIAIEIQGDAASPSIEIVENLIAQSGGGGSITLDSEMSDTSTNAVSNKVIKEYVDSFIPSEFSEDFNDDFTN